jgi:UDP-N-acetylglucosamine--N-acetylmuramyl-(pentapeptide) pyrophosphoryl-undecaprenol N-acetylglucosamine transferase
MITGNPVRNAISDTAVTRTEGLKFFSLSEEKKTILVVGGSLGAKSINEAIDKGLDKLTEAGLQVIWQTGKPYADRARQASEGRANVWASEFIPKMEYAYAAADVVVARSGAITVAELCTAKKPALFVPYPFAAEDHQTVNAIQLVNKNAALMVKDSEAMQKLVAMTIALSLDKEKQEELKRNIAPLGITDADERIAAEILRLI